MANLDANGRPKPPLALTWNPATKDYERDADGLYVERHPVDAAVILALTVSLKGLPGSQETGNELRGIPPMVPTTQSQADTAVRAALSRLIRQGDITIVAVETQGNAYGLLLVTVRYFNERAPRLPGQPPEEKTASLPLAP